MRRRRKRNGIRKKGRKKNGKIGNGDKQDLAPVVSSAPTDTIKKEQQKREARVLQSVSDNMFIP